MTTTLHQPEISCRLDLIDTVNERHAQVQAVLASLLMSFESSESVPGTATVRNTIWAAQALLEQAQEKIKLL